MKFVKCVMLAGALLLTSTALAQQPERPRPGRPERRPGRRPAGAMYERMVGQLNLEGAQQTRVKQMLQTHRQAVENWRKLHGEDLRSLQRQAAKAREERDEKAVRRIRAEMAKINRDQEKQRERLHAQILEVLKGEQKERFARLVLRSRRLLSPIGRVRLALLVVGLNRVQRGKADKIVAATEVASAKITGRRERTALLNKAVQEIKTKVLLDEAKGRKLDQLLREGRGGAFARLNLSAEQQKKVNDIMAAVRDAEPEDRRAAWREAMRKIREEVLTGEQREQLQRLREQGRRDRTRRERPAEGRPARERD